MYVTGNDPVKTVLYNEMCAWSGALIASKQYRRDKERGQEGKVPMVHQYTLRSVTTSGHVKYRRNSLACKMQEDSACNTGDSACWLVLINWQGRSSAKKHGQWSSKNKKRDLSCIYTGHLASYYWECRKTAGMVPVSGLIRFMLRKSYSKNNAA